MSNQNSLFLKDWKKHYIDIFTTIYPEIDGDELNKFLDNVIEKRLHNPKAQLHNNYIHKNIIIDLLSIYDWYDRTKPIAAGFGVFFKNQEQVLNPAAVMLNNFLTLRKTYKKRLKDYSEMSYEYATYDRLQLTEKINANSYYGASGAPTSNFFNIFTATSVTATGQSLISTTELAFEAFMTNNVPFIDADDCINFIRNVVKEKRTMDDKFLPNITIEKLLNRLESTFYWGHCSEKDLDLIFKYLINLDQRDINRIYFKNNLYEFSMIPKIRNKLSIIMNKVESFKDPNEVPESIKDKLEDLWDYYKEFVFYNHFAFNRIDRLKKDRRKTVVTVDTDSNMLNLNPWIIFLKKNIINVDEKLASRDADELRFIGINIMCFILTNMVTEVLWKYGKHANIPKGYRPKINMKNEFLFSRIILSSKKKRYMSSVRLREGKEIFPEKTDVKGHDFVKSSTREDTKKFFMDLIKEKLLKPKTINISEILRELERFENIIRDSLIKGEKNFLIPASVKELEAYNPKTKFRIPGIRAVIAWNYIYPNYTIDLPNKIDMIKVKLGTEKELEKLKYIEPEIYKRALEGIFHNPEREIAEKGIQVIALPRNIEKIPEWLMPYIDYDTIVNDNISRFYSVLESLGIETLSTSKKDYFSNILRI